MRQLGEWGVQVCWMAEAPWTLRRCRLEAGTCVKGPWWWPCEWSTDVPSSVTRWDRKSGPKDKAVDGVNH